MFGQALETLVKEKWPLDFNNNLENQKKIEINETRPLGGIVLEPNIETIKTKSLESIVQSNMENNNLKVNEKGLRPLTEDEKRTIQEKTNMSEDTINKCLIDENGHIHLKCIREDLEGKRNENTGVEYKRKTVDINGVIIEVVVPEFDSIFDTQLSEENIIASDDVQMKECNAKLKEAIKNDPELRSQFTDQQIQMIEKGFTPRGFTWHHDAEKGKMQLIRTDIHSNTRHTGGKAIWGGGQENR